ncbi:MAG TPA: hypothetical protein VLZ81_00095, partial [Blastocatellia bacterium]|nr:hypothetical protein [Blastocatellia bacterium]
LGQGLRLRYTPQLHFVLDKSARAGDRVEEILKEEAGKERGPNSIEEPSGSGFYSEPLDSDSEKRT